MDVPAVLEHAANAAQGEAPDPSRAEPTTFQTETLLQRAIQHLPSLSDDPTRPSHIALRTYALAQFLSLSPSLVPAVIALVRAKDAHQRARAFTTLRRVLVREFRYDGFAFSVTLAVSGGALLNQLWEDYLSSAESRQKCSASASLKALLGRCTPMERAFLSNALASTLGYMLLRSGRVRNTRLKQLKSQDSVIPMTVPQAVERDPSHTLDLTILLLVRAMDAFVQNVVFHRSGSADVKAEMTEKGRADPAGDSTELTERLMKEKEKQTRSKRRRLTTSIDALVFWVCSARIMWCFFYAPHRLPRAYVHWIGTLANVDKRLLHALHLLATGEWSYRHGTKQNILTSYARDLGLPSTWGDPHIIPAYGGSTADRVWNKIGVTNRDGIGGLPCELVHGDVGVGGSCHGNAAVRLAHAFVAAASMYTPVHFVPILLTRPHLLLRPQHVLRTVLGAMRSSLFLSSFVSLFFYTVCFTRTLVLARALPFVHFDYWDGPYGDILLGCLMCGSSIWIEQGKRRGEMALYVLPRALKASLPHSWLRRGGRSVALTEGATFILSTAGLLTAGVHHPDSLRGLSRWALAFMLNGPYAGFWKRRREGTTLPSTPYPQTATPQMKEGEHRENVSSPAAQPLLGPDVKVFS